MVTVPAGFVIDVNDAVPAEGTTAIGIRRALAVLLKQSSPGVATPGRLGLDHLAVTGSPTAMEYNVSGGGVVLVRTGAGGAYIVGLPSGVVIETAPSDGVNPRIDVIYALQPDPALDGSSVDVNFIIDVVSGSPGATPVAPSVPAGALVLARKVIAPGATNTNAGAPFSNVAAVTGLNVADLAWSAITGKPSTFAPSAHTHPASDITGQIGNSQIADNSITRAKINDNHKAVAASANTLVERDANGRARIAAPVGTADIVNKAYVDDKISGRITISGANPSGGSDGDIWLRVI